MIDWPESDVHRGDMRAVLAERFVPETFHAGVTDPPYGLGFMGKGWDHGVPGAEYWAAASRVLKPGAHLAAFSSPRTYHRLAVAIEDAGFEIRDCLIWLYGTGFPKGLDVAKAIDKKRHDRADVLEGWEEKPLHWSSGDANPGSFQSPGTKKAAANFHPTVKPLALMRWVCRLITPARGRIVDPFAGSGSTLCAATLEGFAATGIDLDTDDETGEPIGYVDIARARAAYWRGEAIRLAEGGARPPVTKEAAQLDIF